MFSPVQDYGLRFDELALVLAAVGAFALGLKNFAMKGNGHAPHQNTRGGDDGESAVAPKNRAGRGCR